MLVRLFISNFALIREMEICFPGNLTVITGETGAGKSIFLEALALSLGKRADPAVISDKNKKCIVEAEFNLTGHDLKQFFEEHDLDYETSVLLRREISADGKSRSFLNDTPVNLNALKGLSERLIDIHSQHQTLLINQNNFQLELLDAFAGSLAAYKGYRYEFSNLNKLKNTLEELSGREEQARKELDYLRFLYTELEAANIKAGSLQALEEESAALEHAESIKATLANAAGVIDGHELSLLSALTPVKQSLSALTKFGPRYVDFSERLNAVYIELKELVNELQDAEEGINFDNKRLDEVNSKIDSINRLLKKHNVSKEEDLTEVLIQTEHQLGQYDSLESLINSTKQAILKSETLCKQQATELSVLRNKAITGIEVEVKAMLSGLGMENANFKIEMVKSSDLSSTGFDQVKFLFSANKGAVLQDLQKTASGGELSRLMLTLKSMLAARKKLPVIIFDEIDSGVSGNVGDKIGTILLNMGYNMQVIAITHLAQIASKGKHHLFVYKQDDSDKTFSYIKELTQSERVNEIAKMLSAGHPTQSAINNAEELLRA